MMILKKLNGLFEVIVEMNDGSNERVGEFKGIDLALEKYVDAVRRLTNLIVDRRCVPIFESVQHPQYKMIRIR